MAGREKPVGRAYLFDGLETLFWITGEFSFCFGEKVYTKLLEFHQRPSGGEMGARMEWKNN